MKLSDFNSDQRIKDTEKEIQRLQSQYLSRPDYCDKCGAYVVSGEYKKERVAARSGRKKGDKHISNLIPVQRAPDDLRLDWLCRGCHIKRLREKAKI